MGTYEELDRDYGQLCKDLTTRFGTEFDIAYTGGGFHALSAGLETGEYIAITNGNGIDGLQPRRAMEGWNITINDGCDVKVHLRAPEPRGLLILADDDTIAQELGDLVGQAMRARTFGAGTKVRHRRWPEAGLGVIDAFPAINDGPNPDLAEVTWSDGDFEIEDIRDLIAP